ncbi:alpha-2-macroglobulin family protein [Chryseobacterium caseinilyticum]|uniref:Alpha-2-macroglobulin domain-containing protein n=1 Tax=Chryseobacterium caseinilyticum TaxID=2771428 RepID=A0ABR8Z7F2_9FLAO|nr:MG2 domain-containing protein [Chryseobacterium caseinilyticum]MBD8081165.1 hypothetical protein [Chryseobacterium caseinilyticum]
MKTISKCLLLLFVFFTTFISAQNSYEEQWKKIAEGYKNGEFKSSLPLIFDIQKRAIRDKNAPQIIKSLKAEFGIYKETHDDTKNDYASAFFAKIKETENQLKKDDLLFFKILEIEFFEEYFNRTRYEIQNRTNVAEGNISEIETWTKLDYKNHFTQKFAELSALDNQLKKVRLESYKEALGENTDYDYYPTLYDWKLKKNIDFLNNESIFTKDEIKENHTSIRNLYQNLISFNRGNPQLYFQHQYLIFENSIKTDEQFLKKQIDIVNSPEKGEYKILIVKRIAEELQRKSEFKEAIRWIEKIKSEYPNSKLVSNLDYLENNIKSPFVQVFYEEHNIPEKPIHLVATHKNADRFEIKIYKVNDFKNQLLYLQSLDYAEYYKKIDKTLVRTDVFELPNQKDYKNYSTSLEMKGLPKGLYIGEYINGGDVSKFLFISTSSRVIYDEKKDYILVERETGKRKINTQLQRYYFRDYKNVSETEILIQTDNFAKFPSIKSYHDYHPYLIYDAVSGDFNILNSVYDRDDDYRSHEELYQVFLDREIYRPGQTVHFKVIATRPVYEMRKDVLLVNREQEVVMFDTNHQKISSQKFTTNDFGSFSGSFEIPKDRLNGKFSIYVSGNRYNQKYFSVEEYKRPKFEITFDTIKSEYKYGQTIELKGKVTTFSGVPLSKTAVNFDIKRENIRNRYFWWYPAEYSNENSVLGKVETNEKGEFTIKIDLKKDENVKGIQVHNYKVNATVTDLNGETQSAETNVKVASVSHYLKTNPVSEASANEDLKVKVESFNYNDVALDKSYKVKLMQLKQPERILRNNFKNNIQNLPKMGRDEFLNKFPHDRYDKADDQKNWKVLKTITDETKSGKELNFGKLNAGTYRLLIYNIEGKDSIKTEQDFSVWDKNRLGKNQFPFLKIIGPKTDVIRGSKVTIYAYSAIPDAEVNIYVQDGFGAPKMETKKFSNGILLYPLTISLDKNIEKYNVQFVLAQYNDVQNEYINLNIKNEDPPLKIELTTFRDKLEPNSKEKWSIKILGREKEKVVAEVLANMYDKSLDKFVPNKYSWTKIYRPRNVFKDFNVEIYPSQLYWYQQVKYLETKQINLPQLKWFDENVFYELLVKYGLTTDMDGDGIDDMKDACPNVPGLDTYNGCPSPKRMVAEEVYVSGKMSDSRFAETDGDGVLDKDDAPPPPVKDEDLHNVNARQNLNETVFFYPHLKTDTNGNVSFEFTTPEALTKWKLMFLAHTKDDRQAVLEQDIITQKKLSVTPNYPRFLREGDELSFQTKISNLTENSLNGKVSLQILNADTNEDISSLFGITGSVQDFQVQNTGNAVASWKIKTPYNRVNSIIIKVVAKAGDFSDGEQIPVAVLSNRMLLTDAVPIFVKEGQTKTFTLESLANYTTGTAENVRNTLELKTNPIWEIIFALPDLSENLNISSDDWFNTWFADVVGTEIFKANPRMKAVFDEYKTADLLKSNLEKNQELKQVLLEETPWVLQSQSETETMNRVARLFEVNQMKNSIAKDWNILLRYQNGDGGFPWLPGYESSYSNSLYILKNLGKMNVWLKENISEYQPGGQKYMVDRLIGYIDSQLERYWKETEDNPWSNFALDYLDTRRYWEKEYPITGKGERLKQMIIDRANKFKVTDLTFYGVHRAALIYDNYGLKDTSGKLIHYLKETSVSSETQGAYWKKNLNDWGWYESKAVNHAGAIEALAKIAPNDIDFIEESKIWLATQKETNSWGNSRTTAEIIYIMMNSGKSWTTPEADKATVIWGGKEVAPQTKTTGFLKQTINSDKIDPKLGQVTVTKPGPGIVQGGLFWQYYEDINNAKSTETYISMTREFYKKVKTTNGEELLKITENSPLNVGDRLTVRMILNSDRPMQYVHLKDMRAAGLEPVDVLSGYQYKNNLGYYQATKDASTNFYIYYMPKGKYVFEYDLVCNAAGSFSSGFATLQNYYAPQMNARTKGDKLEIKN